MNYAQNILKMKHYITEIEISEVTAEGAKKRARKVNIYPKTKLIRPREIEV